VSEYTVPDKSEFDLIQILRALGDPIRLNIVTALADGEPHPRSEGVRRADVTKSTMSHHFKVLREAGLTRTIVDGRNQSCQLRRAELDERFPGLIEALIRNCGN
jgi:DNA-binding transcriptional ArsR family regulator